MLYSSIRDNHAHGTVGFFLKEHLKNHSNISIVSAYFTIFAYQHLKENLDNIDELRFLFGDPTFIKSIEPDKTNFREFKIEDDNLVIATEKIIGQKAIARKCSKWLRDKAQIRSMVKPNFLHGKLYHITQASGIQKAIAGSSNFTVNGLGLGGSKNIELNLVIDSDRDRKELKQWFDELWNDKTGLVEDVKAQVLNYLEQLYRENSPEFIWLPCWSKTSAFRPKGAPATSEAMLLSQARIGEGCIPLPNHWLHPKGMFPYCFTLKHFTIFLVTILMSKIKRDCLMKKPDFLMLKFGTRCMTFKKMALKAQLTKSINTTAALLPIALV